MSIIASKTPPLQSFSVAALSRIDREFCQWLQQRGIWSDSIERLFLYLVHNEHVPVPITDQQKWLLEQVIEDALNDVNITERYPAFFRDLLRSAALRHEFVKVTKQIRLTSYPD